MPCKENIDIHSSIGIPPIKYLKPYKRIYLSADHDNDKKHLCHSFQNKNQINISGKKHGHYNCRDIATHIYLTI